jgi:RNA polymerase sigma factor (sigma-70 family)
MNNRERLLFSRDNTATFSPVYQKYWPLLCVYGSKYISDPADVEDLVTDVFIRFLDKPRSFNTMVAVRAFLFKSVFNACINWSIKQGRDDKNQENLQTYFSNEWEDYTLTRLIRNENALELSAAIEGISFQSRKVCKMLYYEGLSLSETAAQLNLSKNTVKNHQSRGLKILRARFNKERIFQ